MLFVRSDDRALMSGWHRGDQIATRLGSDFMTNCKTDTVIFIKGYREEVAKKFMNVYIDLVDSSFFLINQGKLLPHVKFLVANQIGYNYVKWRTCRDVRIIPHHHINFDNDVRPVPNEIKVVGYVGAKARLSVPIYDIRDAFVEVGFDFVTCLMEDNPSIEEMRKAYEQIDIGICFQHPLLKPYAPPELKSHTKIVNHCAYGTPCVGYPEAGFTGAPIKEVYTIDDMVFYAKRLRETKSFYTRLRQDCLEYAKEYHVDVIKEKYKNL